MTGDLQSKGEGICQKMFPLEENQRWKTAKEKTHKTKQKTPDSQSTNINLIGMSQSVQEVSRKKSWTEL